MRKLFAMLLCVALICGGLMGALAEEKYQDTITLTTVQTMNSTITFDESDPLKKSFKENLWQSIWLDELNIQLDYQWIASDWDANTTKWNTAIASGNVPDFGVVSDSVYATLLEAGLVADMTDIFNEYASDLYKSKLSNVNLQQMTQDGKLMGLPMPNAAYHATTHLFIRQDWLDQLNLPVPTNLEEVVNTAKAFKEAKLGGEDTIGLLFGNHDSGVGKWDGFLNAYGAYDNYWVNKDGTLVYGNVQPEMRDALLAMQELYSEGVINQDMAVTTEDMAMEYISSGKVGMWYAAQWDILITCKALWDNDHNAEFACAMPGLGDAPLIAQTNSPSTQRIFVSVDCEHPEAVVKMINLTFDKYYNDYDATIMDDSGFQWYKYLPWGDKPSSTYFAFDIQEAMREYHKTGVFECAEPQGVSSYNNYLSGLEGNEDCLWYVWAYGPDGIAWVLQDAFENGQLLDNAFTGLPTETQVLKGDIVNDAVNTAMFEVVLGSDISVFDKAVETWYATGGQDITDEVNAWYQSVQ